MPLCGSPQSPLFLFQDKPTIPAGISFQVSRLPLFNETLSPAVFESWAVILEVKPGHDMNDSRTDEMASDQI